MSIDFEFLKKVFDDSELRLLSGEKSDFVSCFEPFVFHSFLLLHLGVSTVLLRWRSRRGGYNVD